MYKTLYRKYRPKVFSNLIGNNLLTEAIKNSIINNKISHSYLFSGPRGIGKTTISRLLAKRINCLNPESYEPCNLCKPCQDINVNSFPDLIEIDAASNRGIEEIRIIKEKINYMPFVGKKKIYIIDEVHMLTKEAFNALLKILEEPPNHIVFILATTEKNKIPQTILSRCQKFDFNLVDKEDIIKNLNFILKNEKRDLDIESLNLIAEQSGGSIRDATTLLDKILSSYIELDVNKIREILGIIHSSVIENMSLLFKTDNKNEMIKLIDDLWLRSIDLEAVFKQFAEQSYKNFDTDTVLRLYDLVFTTLLYFKNEDNKKIVCYIIINKLFNLDIKILDLNTNKNIDLVKNKWEEICEELKKIKLSLMVFLKQANVLKIENDILYISFKENIDFYKQSIEKDDNIFLIEKTINDKLNLKLRLKII